MDGSVGPMHKWYDPRAFDLLSREEILSQRAVAASGEILNDARTSAELREAGVDVRFFGTEEEGDAAWFSGASASDLDAFDVEEEVFVRWVERSEFALGCQVARWWVRQRPPEEEPLLADTLWKQDAEDTTVALYEKLGTRRAVRVSPFIGRP